MQQRASVVTSVLFGVLTGGLHGAVAGAIGGKIAGGRKVAMASLVTAGIGATLAGTINGIRAAYYNAQLPAADNGTQQQLSAPARVIR